MWLDGKQIKAKNKKLADKANDIEYDYNSVSFKELHLSAMISSEAKFDISLEKD